MTQKEQRIEIAEFCGWKWYRATGSELVSTIITFNINLTGHWEEIPRPDDYLDNVVAFVNCPDYPNDLNAMRDAESCLGSLGLYYQNLTDVMMRIVGGGYSRGHSQILVSVTTARAEYRSEAFIRTIGKWRD